MNYNYEAIEAVYNHISKHPDQFDMGTYYDECSCGTVACIAGWTCALLDPSFTFNSSSWNDSLYYVVEARRILNISEEETQIFDADLSEEVILKIFAELVSQKSLPLHQKLSIQQIANNHGVFFTQ